ncbi:YcxB family protein [uncultured Cytophaga sp.]|uniref:YcxB family protein n=1 Tax=uncultured Cytophaga sp. TaxID=160238 RepID=UPI00260D66A8|nr:YcxB family protein [uncultured Cytophaga sp.]
MIIKTKVSFKEYVTLLLSLAYKKIVLRLLLGLALVIILWIASYYLHLFNLPKPIIYQYITLFLIVIVQPSIIFILTLRNYNSSNYLQESLEMEITSNEIMITGISFYMEIKWVKFFKIVETKSWFLMYQNSLSAIIIHKKYLSDMDTFRKIVKNIKDVPFSNHKE